MRSEEEVDAYIKEIIDRTKGKYLTQGVSFNKNSERQLRLLKLVLMEADSFSGFIKELLTIRYGVSNTNNVQNNHNNTSDKKSMDEWI